MGRCRVIGTGIQGSKAPRLQGWMEEGIKTWVEELALNTDNDQGPVCACLCLVPSGHLPVHKMYHHVCPYYDISNLPLILCQPWA